MLQALDVTDGHRVLEIATGTGYNAALLSARLGSDPVVTVEVDPVLARLAESPAATLRIHPAGPPRGRP